MLEIKEFGIKIRFRKGYKNQPRLMQERFTYECSVFFPDNSLKTGYAYLNPRDNNNKKLGKIIALRKALNEIGDYFNRQQRTIIWDSFWDWLNK